MEKYKIVLVSGAIGSGKDTICDFLVQSHGFKKISFADKLREISLFLLDDLYGCEVSINHFMDRELKESFIMTKEGRRWVANGVHMTYRQFVRLIATDALRDLIQKTTWVDYVKRAIIDIITSNTRKYNGVCIPDWRFINEYEEMDKLLENFGNITDLMTVHIIRPGYISLKNDNIEGLLKDFKFNFCIKNDESLENLYKKVNKLASGSYVKEKIIEEEIKRGSLKFI